MSDVRCAIWCNSIQSDVPNKRWYNSVLTHSNRRYSNGVVHSDWLIGASQLHLCVIFAFIRCDVEYDYIFLGYFHLLSSCIASLSSFLHSNVCVTELSSVCGDRNPICSSSHLMMKLTRALCCVPISKNRVKRLSRTVEPKPNWINVPIVGQDPCWWCPFIHNRCFEMRSSPSES